MPAPAHHLKRHLYLQGCTQLHRKDVVLRQGRTAVSVCVCVCARARARVRVCAFAHTKCQYLTSLLSCLSAPQLCQFHVV